MRLNRLLVTGKLDYNTPRVVLEEIGRVQGHSESLDTYSDSELLRCITRDARTIIIKKNTIDRIELRDMTTYINPDFSMVWKSRQLYEAFEYLYSFVTIRNTQDPLRIVKLPLENYGCQTPNSIYSLNACVLYRICTYWRISLTRRTTLQQMFAAVNLLLQDVETLSLKCIDFVKRTPHKYHLINLLLQSPRDFDPVVEEYLPKSTEYNLQELPFLFPIISACHPRCTPLTQCEAIGLAAHHFQIDLTKAADAMREYLVLREYSHNYIPRDSLLRSLWEMNKELIDLKITFNPKIPREYYKEETLKQLLLSEGGNSDSFEDNYLLLQEFSLYENFHLGLQNNVSRTETLQSLENICEIPTDSIVCFGVRNSVMEPMTFTELTEIIQHNKNFTNPFQRNSVFPDYAIRKLKLLCTKYTGNDTVEYSRLQLLNTINSVELELKETNEFVISFFRNYSNSPREVKNNIIKKAEQLLHFGLYLRGWKGHGEYPLSLGGGDELEISINVTNSIIELENPSCREFLELPLVRFISGNYSPSTSEHDGFTIFDRIRIVKEGISNSSSAACIALSSNWILSSCHKYYILLGLREPFNIQELISISSVF